LNTTLTTIAAALVLLLATALIGPHFIDWTAYRAEFEARASEIVGAPVRIRGAVDARLLPNPSLRFHDVAIGNATETTRLEAREFTLRLSPAPLLKGDIHVRDMTVSDPRLTLEIGPDGEVALPVEGAGMARIDPARITLDRIDIEDGAIVLRDPEAGRTVELTGITGSGTAGSLTGPFRFDGGLVLGPDRYEIRLGTGRFGAERTQAKLEVKPAGEPVSFSLDGFITVEALRPRYEGGVVLAHAPAAGAGAAAEPWRIAGTVKADAREVAFDDLDLRYGPEERVLRLEGFGDIDLGKQPRGRFGLSARQLDLDRLLGPSDEPRRPDAVLAEILGQAGSMPLPLPLDLDLKVDGVLIGQELVQDLQLSFASEAEALRVETARARFPGQARAAAAGRLMLGGDGPRFAGRVEAEAGDVPLLLRWLTGGREPDLERGVRRLSAAGEVDASATRVALTEARLSADGEVATGKVEWRLDGGVQSLSSVVTAKRLDLDALNVVALYRSLAGRAGTPPGVDLSLDANELRYRGLTARGVAIDLAASGGDLRIRRFRLGDLGGASVDTSGDLAIDDGRVTGQLTGRVRASRLDGLAALLADAPVPDAVARAFAHRAVALAPMDAEVTFGADPDSDGGVVLRAGGEAGGSRLDLRINADTPQWDATIDAEAEVVSSDANRLLAQLGLPVVALEHGGEGRLSVIARGALAERVETEIALSGLGASITAIGDLRAGKNGLAGSLETEVTARDAAPILARLGRLPPVSLRAFPLRLTGLVAFQGDRLMLEAVKGEVDGRDLSGRLAFSGVDLRTVEGKADIERLALDELAVLALGPLALGEGVEEGAAWPGGPVAPGLFQGLAGKIALTIGEAKLPSLPPMRDVTATLVLARDGLAIEDVGGSFAGGRLEAGMGFRVTDDGVALRMRAETRDAALKELAWRDAGGTPVAEGRLAVTLDAGGAGGTLGAAIVGLSGSGTLTVMDARLGGLDPKAFAQVEAAADAGLALESDKLAAAFAKALAGGELAVQEATGAFSIAAGTLRLSNLAVEAPQAAVSATAVVDLGERSLAANIALAPRGAEADEAGAAPQVMLRFNGPVDAPQRSLDITGLTGFLTAKAIEREVRNIEALEAEAHERKRLQRVREVQLRRRRAEEEARAIAARRAEEERLAREAPPISSPVAPPPGATGSVPGGPRGGGSASQPLVIVPQPQAGPQNERPRNLIDLFR
jgi:uncharacterized protein involved in outer membrane biogenesis